MVAIMAVLELPPRLSFSNLERCREVEVRLLLYSVTLFFTSI